MEEYREIRSIYIYIYIYIYSFGSKLFRERGAKQLNIDVPGSCCMSHDHRPENKGPLATFPEMCARLRYAGGAKLDDENCRHDRSYSRAGWSFRASVDLELPS